MRNSIIVVVAFAAAPLFAQRLTLTPSHADSNTVVTAVVAGTFVYGGCLPQFQDAVRSGTAIDILFRTDPASCLQATDWSRQVKLGPFPAGLYDVRVFVDDQLHALRTLFVTDAKAHITVDPYVALERGGATVDIVLDSLVAVEGARVTFDGVDATNVQVFSQRDLRAVVPPHAAGAVDVTVISKLAIVKQADAFVYFSETAPPDESLFEPRLVPVLDDTDGAGGTHWTSTGIFFDAVGKPIPTQRPLTGDTLLDFGTAGKSVLISGAAARRPHGVLWYPLRDAASNAHVTVRVHEATSDTTAQMPAPREGAMGSIVEIFDVPRGRQYRVSLRVWSLDDTGEPVHVITNGLGTGGAFALADLPLIRYADDEPLFGQIADIVNLTPYSLHLPADDRMRVEIRGAPWQRLWALVSVFDTATNQFRVLTPQ